MLRKQKLVVIVSILNAVFEPHSNHQKKQPLTPIDSDSIWPDPIVSGAYVSALVVLVLTISIFSNLFLENLSQEKSI